MQLPTIIDVIDGTYFHIKNLLLDLIFIINLQAKVFFQC